MNKINLLWGMLLLCTCFCVGCSDDDSEDFNTPPVVTDFFPKEGDIGTQVTISGENFGSSSEGNVYFNGIEASEYVSYTDKEIVAVVPSGYVSGPITVKRGNVGTRTKEHFNFKSSNPEDNYETGTFHTTVTCKDVVYFTGKANPCDYTSEDATSGCIGEMGKNADYKGSSDAKSFALWDSNSGDMVIFKVEIADIGRYYVSCASATNANGVSANVEISNDLEALKNVSSLTSSYMIGIVNNGKWNDFSNTLEFGGYILNGSGTYYVRVVMLNESGSGSTACLKFIEIFN
jgi:hypothetical protein